MIEPQDRLGPIAIVDDDMAFREALAGLLASFDMDAMPFASGWDLLRSDSLPRLRCLLVDVQMPGIGGVELRQRLALSGHHLPVIFVSSHLDERTRARALSFGACGFVTKPFDSEELLGQIHALLNVRRQPD